MAAKVRWGPEQTALAGEGQQTTLTGGRDPSRGPLLHRNEEDKCVYGAGPACSPPAPSLG